MTYSQRDTPVPHDDPRLAEAAPEMYEALRHVQKMFAQMPSLKTGYIGEKVAEALRRAEAG